MVTEVLLQSLEAFDVLEALGIKIISDPKKIEKFFSKNNICFLFAPYFHTALKNVANIRKSIPFRTIFNLLGPLLNPVKLSYQLLGVSEEKNLITHAKCLKQLGIKRLGLFLMKKVMMNLQQLLTIIS